MIFLRYVCLFFIAISIFIFLIAIQYYTGPAGRAFDWVVGSIIAIFISVVAYTGVASATEDQFAYKDRGGDNQSRNMILGCLVISSLISIYIVSERAYFYSSSVEVESTVTGSYSSVHSSASSPYQKVESVGLDIEYSYDNKTYKSTVGADPVQFSNGSKIVIRIDPSNPEKAHYHIWFGPIMLSLLPLLFLFCYRRM